MSITHIAQGADAYPYRRETWGAGTVRSAPIGVREPRCAHEPPADDLTGDAESAGWSLAPQD